MALIFSLLISKNLRYISVISVLLFDLFNRTHVEPLLCLLAGYLRNDVVQLPARFFLDFSSQSFFGCSTRFNVSSGNIPNTGQHPARCRAPVNEHTSLMVQD
jgi:hypothetical protein